MRFEKTVPSLSVGMACGAALRAVQEAIASLRRSPLDASHVCYGALSSAEAALSAMLPSHAIPAALTPQELPQGATIIGKPLDPIKETPVIVEAPSVTSTGANDIEVADRKLVDHLTANKRLTVRQLRDWGATTEQLARLEFAKKIVPTGKGRSKGYMTPEVAEVITPAPVPALEPASEEMTVADVPPPIVVVVEPAKPAKKGRKRVEESPVITDPNNVPVAPLVTVPEKRPTLADAVAVVKSKHIEHASSLELIAELSRRIDALKLNKGNAEQVGGCLTMIASVLSGR